jgi:hypothetical protein
LTLKPQGKNVSILKVDRSSEELHEMGSKWKKSERTAVIISAGVAGGVTGVLVGLAAATDLSPVLIGVFAALLSALLGTIAFTVILRVLGEQRF